MSNVPNGGYAMGIEKLPEGPLGPARLLGLAGGEPHYQGYS